MMDGNLATQAGLVGMGGVNVYAGYNNTDTIQIIAGEVIEIITNSGDANIGKIRVKLLTERNSGTENSQVATCFNSNIRLYPLLHEIVPIIILNDAYYWDLPMNIDNYIHNNASNKASYLDTGLKQKYPNRILTTVSSKNAYKLSDVDDINDLKSQIPLLSPSSGDMIFQGRHTNSIRLGNNKKNNAGIIKINVSTMHNKYGSYKEDINNDSLIWLSTVDTIEFAKIGIGVSKETDMPTKYDGNQIFMMSDRIVIGARKNEILGFSNKNISFSCNKNFSVDSDSSVRMKATKSIVFDSNRVNIGKDAKSPIVLGDKLIKLLSELLITLANDIHTTAPTLGSPTLGSINKTKYIQLSNKLQELVSKISFTV